MSDLVQDIINLEEYIKDMDHRATLDRITDRLEEALGINHQLRAEIKNKDDALWKLKMYLHNGYWQEDVSPVVLIDQMLNTKPEGR